MNAHIAGSVQYRKIFTIQMPLCLAEIYLPTHCFGTESVIGRGLHNSVSEMRGGTLTGYFGEEDMREVGAAGLRKFSDRNFVEHVKQLSHQAASALVAHSAWVDARNPANLTNDELKQLYLEQIERIQAVYAYFNISSPAISIAMEDEIDRLMCESRVPAEAIDEVKGAFLQSTEESFLEKEEADLRRVALAIRKDAEAQALFALGDYREIVEKLSVFGVINDMTALHEAKYAFLQGYVDFHLFDTVYFLHRLTDLIRAPADSIEISGPYVSRAVDIKEKQDALRRSYGLDERLIHWLELAGYLSHHRMEMRVYFTRGLVSLRRMLDEFSRRMNISTTDVRYTLIQENLDFLDSGAMVPAHTIAERKEYAILHIEEKKIKLKVGEEARRWAKEHLPSTDFSGVSSVEGQTGNSGIRRGRVALIADTADLIKEMSNMEEGAILVTRNTRPDMILACKKAAAIVTDEGGILSHAALVSREFGIPCVIGTRDATKIFKDGDLVEVDAERGVVSKVD